MRTNRRDGQRSLPTTFQPFAPFGCLLVIALLLGPPFPALAAPGDFDPSFDADGRVLTHFGRFEGAIALLNGFEGAIALLVQSDGKLVAGGFSNASDPSSNDFALARYNPDGSLDSSFGAGGLVLTAFGGQDFYHFPGPAGRRETGRRRGF
ncbi:MAG: delta-60 repeat domain-containing protein [Pseudomonadota bacterium]|nr:delta-60 repeat domain-containing protein [Pseudomonadota bacterium]